MSSDGSNMTNDVWVLGATGRTGEAITRELIERGTVPVLVGRSREKLEAAARTSGARTVIATSPTEMAAAIRRERPTVVINTIGPFRKTSDELAGAAVSAGHYLDLANDLPTILAHRERDAAARRAGHTIVTGAGFGVTATESLLTWITTERPGASKVRVDMIPSIASTTGRVGEALAGSLLDGIPGTPGGGRFQARTIAHAKLTAAPLAGSPTSLVTPDGDVVTTGLMPLGELLAAQRASGAPFIESASSEAPSGIARIAVRGMLPLMHLAPLRRLTVRLVAGVRTPEREAPRRHSWAHALVEWPDGTTREGWLRLADANDVTASVAAEVATRLAAGRGTPGVYTPAELFGAELAESCGGVYSLTTEDS
jgi:short subunit dehydrogenase-like uncharacterized protein